MKVFNFLAAASAILLPTASSLNILLGNDDSWASANIREFYKALKAAGHKVLLVAPAVNQSGKGGTTVFTELRNLSGPAEFNSVSAGAPSFGYNISDPMMWYYNGTPAACTFFALDYVIPRVWNGTLPDLFVAGPNEGNNAGPFLYTLSGTVGSTYAAIERGIPGIAFSAGNGTHRPWTAVSGTNDVATLNANVAVKLVNQLVGKQSNGRILPLGYGINVNYPSLNSSCSAPPYIQSRLTGGAIVDKAVLNTTSGIFSFGNDINAGLNACINGDCTLPGETNVINSCAVAVSVFTTDYDAPSCGGSANVRSILTPLVTYANSTSSGTGIGSSGSSSSSSARPSTTGAGTGTVSSNSTATGTTTRATGAVSGTGSAPAQASTNAAVPSVLVGGWPLAFAFAAMFALI